MTDLERDTLRKTLTLLESAEWEGSDAYGDPLCAWCRREAPEYEKRESTPIKERHDPECAFVDAVLQARRLLGVDESVR